VDRLSESASAHESDDQLELYALDRLNDSETIRVEEHLMVCEPCRERLEEIAAFALAIRDVLKEHPEPSSEPANTWWERLREKWLGLPVWKPQFALAAVAAVLVAGLAVSIHSAGGGGNLPAVASLQLTVIRGAIPTVQASRELDLTLADIPATANPLRFEILDHAGSPVWSGAPDAERHLRVTRRLAQGSYLARVYDAPGKLLREYGFTVTR
jgi:hypothetical protein